MANSEEQTEPEKPWNRAWTYEEIRANANRWSLAGDSAVLHVLRCHFQQLISSTHLVRNGVNQLEYDVAGLTVDLVDSFNEFMSLANTQFVENRVYDLDVTQPAAGADGQARPAKADDQPTEGQVLAEISRSVQTGINVMNNNFDKEPVELNGPAGDTAHQVRLVPKMPYNHRPLPHLIGTKLFLQDSTCGLATSQQVAAHHDQPQDQRSAGDVVNGQVETAGPSAAPSNHAQDLFAGGRDEVAHQVDRDDDDDDDDLFTDPAAGFEDVKITAPILPKKEDLARKYDDHDEEEPMENGPLTSTGRVPARAQQDGSSDDDQSDSDSLFGDKKKTQQHTTTAAPKSALFMASSDEDGAGGDNDDDDDGPLVAPTGSAPPRRPSTRDPRAGLLAAVAGLGSSKYFHNVKSKLCFTTCPVSLSNDQDETLSRNSSVGQSMSASTKEAPSTAAAMPPPPSSRVKGGLFDDSDEDNDDDLVAAKAEPPPLAAASKITGGKGLFGDSSDDDDNDDDDLFGRGKAAAAKSLAASTKTVGSTASSQTKKPAAPDVVSHLFSSSEEDDDDNGDDVGGKEKVEQKPAPPSTAGSSMKKQPSSQGFGPPPLSFADSSGNDDDDDDDNDDDSLFRTKKAPTPAQVKAKPTSSSTSSSLPPKIDPFKNKPQLSDLPKKTVSSLFDSSSDEDERTPIVEEPPKLTPAGGQTEVDSEGPSKPALVSNQSRDSSIWSSSSSSGESDDSDGGLFKQKSSLPVAAPTSTKAAAPREAVPRTKEAAAPPAKVGEKLPNVDPLGALSDSSAEDSAQPDTMSTPQKSGPVGAVPVMPSATAATSSAAAATSSAAPARHVAASSKIAALQSSLAINPAAQLMPGQARPRTSLTPSSKANETAESHRSAESKAEDGSTPSMLAPLTANRARMPAGRRSRNVRPTTASASKTTPIAGTLPAEQLKSLDDLFNDDNGPLASSEPVAKSSDSTSPVKPATGSNGSGSGGDGAGVKSKPVASSLFDDGNDQDNGDDLFSSATTSKASKTAKPVEKEAAPVKTRSKPTAAVIDDIFGDADNDEVLFGAKRPAAKRPTDKTSAVPPSSRPLPSAKNNDDLFGDDFDDIFTGVAQTSSTAAGAARKTGSSAKPVNTADIDDIFNDDTDLFGTRKPPAPAPSSSSSASSLPRGGGAKKTPAVVKPADLEDIFDDPLGAFS